MTDATQDESIRMAFDILSSDHQPPPSIQPTPKPSTTTPRKRKNQSNVEPRRSRRKHVPTYNPDYISNPDDYDAAFESSRNGSGEPVEETTEMNYSFDRDSSVEIMSVSDRNVDMDGVAGGTSSSRPAVGKPFKAPTAPMMTTSARTKTPISAPKPLTKQIASSNPQEEARSTAAEVATSKTPVPYTKIVKLSMPSSKAQAKPLGNNFGARRTSSEGNLPAAQPSAPPQKGTEGVLRLGVADPRTEQVVCKVLAAHYEKVRSESGPRASGTSEGSLELQRDTAERAVIPPNEREAQPYAMTPDNVLFSRAQLEGRTPSTVSTAPALIIPSEPVAVPSQDVAEVEPIPPLQVARPQPAPTPPPAPAATAPSFKASPTPTPKPAPKAKSQIPLWVITRNPHPTEELWDTGRLSGLTLPSFLASLSLLTSRSADLIDKVIFTLRTPISNTKISVGREAEDSWSRVMVTFKKKLMEVKGKSLSEVCSILIDPVWEEVLEGEDGEMAEEDVYF
ncbi:hypothetical protein ONS96_004037 [Cadophora gregata f. sp. sojae]|nr:hypothetical protein ONS96_004037 [Cadophora gregata f. sp. sojae]